MRKRAVVSGLVLRRPNGRAFHLGPVDARVERLVDQPHETDILAADDVQAQRDLDRRFSLVRTTDHALDRVLEDLGGEESQIFPKVRTGPIPILRGLFFERVEKCRQAKAYQVRGVVVRREHAD
jgi:hypothetical protein